MVRMYCGDLVRNYEPEKFLEYYKTLPTKLQADETVYFCYGYAYYLLIKTSNSVLERDVYVSRARTVFTQLKQKGYSIGDMEMWLNEIDAQ